MEREEVIHYNESVISALENHANLEDNFSECTDCCWRNCDRNVHGNLALQAPEQFCPSG